jgi:hypothetical protein
MRAKRAPAPIPTNLYVDQLSADPGDISWKSQFYHLSYWAPASSTTGANVHTTTCPYLPPLGNDLRAVFHNQNHMLLLCTSSAVLVAKQVNHVSGGKDGRRSELYLS